MNPFHTSNHMYVSEVTLMVKNKEKSIKFYTEALGMKVIRDNNHEVTLGTHSNHELVHLIENPNALPKLRTTGLYHFALLFKNRGDLGQILRHFITIRQGIVGGADHGISEAIYLEDPDGNGIELAWDRPDYKFKYLPNGDIDLLSDNTALDYRNLLEHSTLGDFKKIPDDTIMGHLHLHVSDLNKANHFFIDSLGFQSMFYYSEQAHFISDLNYHHHLAFNLWNGKNVPNNPNDAIGLKSYKLMIPSDRYDALIKRFTTQNIPVFTTPNAYYIIDPNGVKVILEKHIEPTTTN